MMSLEFLKSLFFMPIKEAQWLVRTRYPGWRLYVKGNVFEIYDHNGVCVFRMETRRK